MRVLLRMRHKRRCAVDLTVECTHRSRRLRARGDTLWLGCFEVWRLLLGYGAPVVDMVVSTQTFSRPSGERPRCGEDPNEGQADTISKRGLKPGTVLNRVSPHLVRSVHVSAYSQADTIIPVRYPL